jgi:anti-sigma regulatory factor (Ser/Thr protein kinase)
MLLSSRQTFDGRPESVREARAFVEHELAAHDLDGTTDLAGLLVTELATNVVRHARGSYSVGVELVDGHLHLEVADHNPTQPVHIPPEPGRVGGWGVHIVAELASNWGVEQTDDGKLVWFDLPVTRNPH